MLKKSLFFAEIKFSLLLCATNFINSIIIEKEIVDSIYHMYWNIKIALRSLIELENVNVMDVIA